MVIGRVAAGGESLEAAEQFFQTQKRADALVERMGVRDHLGAWTGRAIRYPRHGLRIGTQ